VIETSVKEIDMFEKVTKKGRTIDEDNSVTIKHVRNLLNIPKRHKWTIVKVPLDMKVDQNSILNGMIILDGWNGSFHESMGGVWGVLVHARGFRGVKNRASRVKFVPVQHATCKAASRAQVRKGD